MPEDEEIPGNDHSAAITVARWVICKSQLTMLILHAFSFIMALHVSTLSLTAIEYIVIYIRIIYTIEGLSSMRNVPNG